MTLKYCLCVSGSDIGQLSVAFGVFGSVLEKVQIAHTIDDTYNILVHIENLDVFFLQDVPASDGPSSRDVSTRKASCSL